jgi:hypothetical protein
MGLIPAIKKWLSMPLEPNSSVFNLTIYIGILFVIAWLWSSVIGGIQRGMEIIEP